MFNQIFDLEQLHSFPPLLFGHFFPRIGGSSQVQLVPKMKIELELRVSS